MNKVIFWDFQGTLAYNDFMISKALHKVILQNEPDTEITIEQIKKLKIPGIPWQDCEKDYSHLTINGEWWKFVEKLFEEAYKELSIDECKLSNFARQAHMELAKPDEFTLYSDSIETLKYFKLNGWRNIILSNHIPELPYIVESLGLGKYITDCISSANVGFEKPNMKIYEFALNKAKHPKNVWMVGDSLLADVNGPERAGIKGVLVRANEKINEVKYSSKDLLRLREIIR
ncbi:HAD family hydrolase [Clostridium sp. C2-6-12]|uniref:HAD family hydrolase n=1 Tax=Clostridium sp. C2-6-12 TaxID=2698832 RepID=UPI00136C9F54|nr:HAD family hydrolase [Clostridium sp. C2-6-12]